MVTLPPMQLGSVAIYGCRAVVHQRAAAISSFDGILGFDLVNGGLSMKIDVPRRQLIITDRSSPVRCIVSQDRMKFSSVTSIGTATDKMEADVSGRELEIGFNSKFILDALKACETEEIRMEFNSANQPILILPTEGEAFLFLVLPVRI